MKYKAVLFDMDGVILDSEPIHFAAFQTTLANFGHELDADGFKTNFVGKTDEEGFKQYFSFIKEDADISQIMSEKAKKYIELASDQLSPYPGIVSMIKKLSLHVPLAIVTGSLRAEADLAMHACGLEGVFTTIVAAEDVTHSKPNPEGYLKAAQILRVNPNNCVVVEDSPSGVASAVAAGIDCIAVTNTHLAKDLQSATMIVDQLSEDLF